MRRWRGRWRDAARCADWRGLRCERHATVAAKYHDTAQKVNKSAATSQAHDGRAGAQYGGPRGGGNVAIDCLMATIVDIAVCWRRRQCAMRCCARELA